LDEREKALTRAEIIGWSLPLSIGFIALILALTLPIRYISWSGWIYFSMAVLVPLHRSILRRRLRRL
jgi:hypothetical protein